MNIVKNTQEVVAVFNDDSTERYSLLRTWNTDAPRACVIMIYPVSDNIFSIDLTSCLTLTNLHKLGYGSCEVVNICPKILAKNKDVGEIKSEANLQQIAESAKLADTVIIAWGSVGEFNRKVNERIVEILKILKPFEEKVVTTFDGKSHNVHPLCPSLRSRWLLEKLIFPALPEPKADAPDEPAVESKKKRKNARGGAKNDEKGVEQPHGVEQESTPTLGNERDHFEEVQTEESA